MCDGMGLNCDAGDAIRAASCCGTEVPNGCLLVRSTIVAATQVRALIFVEMTQSVVSSVASPRRL